MKKKSRPTAWSGPSRRLFCSLHLPGWASACFTDTLLAGLTSRILAPGPSEWLSLEAEVRDAPLCHSPEEPDEPAWHQFHLSPLSPLEQRLLSPSQGSQHTVGSHSGTLFQTRQTPRPSNPWCLCCWLQALSSGLKVGKYRPCGHAHFTLKFSAIAMKWDQNSFLRNVSVFGQLCVYIYSRKTFLQITTNLRILFFCRTELLCIETLAVDKLIILMSNHRRELFKFCVFSWTAFVSVLV